VQDTAQPLK